MKVVVGSKNPAKIEAVRQAFVAVFPNEEIEIAGIYAVSGVSSQPKSDTESIMGARNRARSALEKAPDSTFAVGVEGGLQETEGHWFDCGWIVIRDKMGKEGIGSTIRMEVPEKMMKLIRQGKELGTVIDLVFHTKNAKQDIGHFGLMSNRAVTRTSGYRDGVISALVRFLHPELFDPGDTR